MAVVVLTSAGHAPGVTTTALGLALGRLFGISYPMIFYLGRLFNFVFVSAILYFCIREARVGKRIFFMLSLVPELMFLNSCYSVDPLTIAGTFCFFVLFFKRKLTLAFKLFYLGF